MSLTLDELLDIALKLPGEDRIHLAESLLASVDEEGKAPFHPEWLAEAKRRAARIDSGETRTLSWDEVREAARKRLGGAGHG